MAVTNAAGAASSINSYDEYGAPGPSNSGRFQYTGQAWLPEAQLYHDKARAYAPNLGRFLQADPIGFGGGMNLHAYVGNDPVNWRDPWGLQEEDEIVIPGRRPARFPPRVGFGGGRPIELAFKAAKPLGAAGGLGQDVEDEVVVTAPRNPAPQPMWIQIHDGTRYAIPACQEAYLICRTNKEIWHDSTGRAANDNWPDGDEPTGIPPRTCRQALMRCEVIGSHFMTPLPPNIVRTPGIIRFPDGTIVRWRGGRFRDPGTAFPAPPGSWPIF